MKKLIIIDFLSISILILIACFITAKITTAKIISDIKIDGVDELDKGIITLEIDGQYYDYEYEYVEGFKTLQERINNGENVNEWVEIIY